MRFIKPAVLTGEKLLWLVVIRRRKLEAVAGADARAISRREVK